jgi:trehalose 6-phosphate phosphatase
VKPLLDAAGLAALARFVRRDTLVAFDFDGTLAPIVPDPAQAAMRPGTHQLFDQLTRRLPTVVITGRSRLDLLGRMPGISSLEVIGNHGLETDGAGSSRYLRQVEGWRAPLAEALAGQAGVWVEDKRYSLAVHYRGSPDPEAARQVIERAGQALGGVRIVGGKRVVNLIPAQAPDKGRALLAACTRLGCSRAIYAGDDDTDEDVFALNREDAVLTIRVGEREDSSATYFVPEQGDIDALLEALLARVAGAAAGGRRP